MPLRPCVPAQVCSRGDLDPSHASLEGCYDSKATSAALFFGWPDTERDGRGGGGGGGTSKPAPWAMGAWAINGPTTQGQAPFTWPAAASAAAGDKAAAGPNGQASAVNAGDATVRQVL